MEDFLRALKSQHTGKTPSVLAFKKELAKKMEDWISTPPTLTAISMLAFPWG